MIRRIDRGRNHWYEDEDGQRVPGVTTIISDGLPKPALINWAGNATAEAAVDQWDELSQLAPTARLKALKDARYANRDAAANKGTKVHALAEQLVHGEAVTAPDELAGHVESYVRFLDEYDVQPVLVERVVHSGAYNYAGSFDLIATIGDDTWLLDIKTSRSGIFGDIALQLAAYRYADVWIDEDEDEEQPMPEIDLCGGIHVRADGYDLHPVEAGPDQHRQFLYVQQVAEFMAGSRDLVSSPLESPGTSTWRLVRDDDT